MAEKRVRRAYTVANILNKKFNPLEFSGEWQTALGNPDSAFSALIWGDSGNGKTEFAIQLAMYLTHFGRVAYNSLEQGMSATMQAAIERNFDRKGKHNFLLIDREPFAELLKRMSRPRSPQFLLIDSVQYMRMNKNQYYQIKELMQKKGKGVIWISQSKGKEPRGALADDIRFDVDLKLWVEGFKMFPEGRLNGGGEPYTIWEERAAKYWMMIKE